MTEDQVNRKLKIDELIRIGKISKRILPEEQNIPNTDFEGISIPVRLNEVNFPGANKMMNKELINSFNNPQEIEDEAVKRMRERLIIQEMRKQILKDPSFNPYGGNV